MDADVQENDESDVKSPSRNPDRKPISVRDGER